MFVASDKVLKVLWMNARTAETEGCERWAPNLYLHPNQQGRHHWGRQQENTQKFLEEIPLFGKWLERPKNAKRQSQEVKRLPARNLGPEHPKTSGICVMRNVKEFKQMFLLPSLRIINMDSTHPELLICQCSTRMEKDTTNYGRLTWRRFSTPCWWREFFLSPKSEIDL